MQKPKREITISNRYLYYYASLLKRIYGLIIRNEHKNQPDERYIGHLDEDAIPSSQEEGRLPGTPVQDEIVLFRFRKRLLLGTCQAVLPRKISEITVLSEDGRRLRFHHPNLVYLTGTSSTDVPLKTYAMAVHALSREIDLEAVWEIAVESATPLSLYRNCRPLLQHRNRCDTVDRPLSSPARWRLSLFSATNFQHVFALHGRSGILPPSTQQPQKRSG